MTAYDFDYFVIGAGSGGTRSARIAAQHGARVAIAEERYFGGTCVNVGCVPKKLMVYASHFGAEFADAAGYGWTVGGTSHDWKAFIAAKDTEIERLARIYGNLLEGAGCTVFEERAVLEDAHTVRMGDRRVTADRILIATGGWPTLTDEPGAREYGITSNEIFHLPERPQRVVIAGGGYIGVEFAGILHGFGSEVTQVYRGPLFLRGFDIDLREALSEQMASAGISLRFNTKITRIEKARTCLMVELSSQKSIEADCVLYAIGRTPNTAGLGLEAAGVALSPTGAIPVDEDYRTNVPNIYAVGDVIERVALTPVAIAEGHWLADTLFGPGRPRVEYRAIPSAVFSTPPIGTVGMTEAEARQRLGEVDIYRSAFRPMRHVLAGREERSVMKLVVERSSQRVVGAHMIGLDAPEIVQGIAIAVAMGATKADFDRTVGIHPTSAEEFVTMRQKAPDPEPEDLAAE